MKKTTICMYIFLFVSFSSTVLAVPAGNNIEYTNNTIGKVIFSGDSHAQKGLKCNACHPELFSLKKGTTKIQFADHHKGKKYCFSCHNGKSAFGAKDTCSKCHKKEPGNK